MVLGLALLGAFQLASWAFHQLIGLLINILMALFGALAIEPAVDWMTARGMRRGAAAGPVLLAVLVVAGLFFGLLGSVLADQISTIVRNLPGLREPRGGLARPELPAVGELPAAADDHRADGRDPSGGYLRFGDRPCWARSARWWRFLRPRCCRDSWERM
jgi:hypothetical protein